MSRQIRGPRRGNKRRLLVLDASYTFQMIRDRGLLDSVTCRDLDGFFDHVWSVHPFASMLNSPDWSPRFGRPVTYGIDARHSFIEGKVGRFAWLDWLPPLNFLLSQIDILLRLVRLVRREGIGVIRVGDPLYLGLLGWLLARLSGAALLVRVNGNYEELRKQFGAPLYPRLFRSMALERKVERFVLGRADAIAAINPDNLDYAIKAGAPRERSTLFRLGNLIGREHLVPPDERSLDPQLFRGLGVEPGRYLLCIGRLIEVKLPDHVLRAYAMVRQRGFDLRLVLAGDGPMRDELEEEAARLGLADRLVFAGNQTQEALAQLIPGAAAVVSPLTGRTLAEAAFGAAPIAAYDKDWQSELVDTGVTGELVPYGDEQALGEALIRLLSDRVYASRMGAAARERALAMLDPERLNAHERDVYRRLLERRPLMGAP